VTGEAPVFGACYFQRGGRYVRAVSERPRPRELIFNWDGMDFVCCGIVPDSVRDKKFLISRYLMFFWPVYLRFAEKCFPF
jgi:hypothetical protein